ncbi:MAG: BTAD domain-containing putative transcriptional regulator [Caldilineaceae bacterium]
MALHLHLFGPPRLTRDGGAIALNHRKAWALLAYLAVTARPYSRDSLATLLWPDYGQAAARSHLRRELARLRDLLGEGYFAADREQIALAATGQERIVVDVTIFQHAVTAAQGCQHAAVTDCPTCLPHLIAADGCYGDHFLAGFTLPDSPAFDEWQFFQREQLHAAQGWVLARLSIPPPDLPQIGEAPKGYPGGVSLDQALYYARRWVAHDPLHEPAHRTLIALYAQSGQPAAALRQYETCVRLLHDELGVPPETETTALYAAIRPRRGTNEMTRRQDDKMIASPPAAEPGRPVGTQPHPVSSSSGHPVMSAPPPLHALPSHSQPFIGRQTELAYYQGLLATQGIAVISGMAGVGKTALALALAHAAAPRHAIFWHTCQPDEGVDGLVWRLAAFLAERGQAELWQMLQGTPADGRAQRGAPPPLSALIDYLLQMVQRDAYLLCLDDLHHLAQEASAVELARRLTQLAQTKRLSLIVTTRQKLTLPGLTPDNALAGLSLDDTRNLLRQHNLWLTPDLVHQLHAETEGNGEFLALAIQALRRTDDPYTLIEQLAAAEDLERHLLALVNNLLSPAEGAVMAAVAILDGYPGTRQAIEAISEELRVRDALLSLATRYLLTAEPGPQGQRYSTHALVQKFFYNGLHRRERQTMHRRAAVHYATEEVDAIQAALHYLRATAMDDAAHVITANLQHLIGQGRLHALQRLLTRFRQGDLDSLLWAAICVAKGQVYALLGERESAHAAYAEAHTLLGTLPHAPVLQAELLLGLAGLAEQESFTEAVRLAQQGLDVLGDADPLLAASLYLKQAGFLAAQGEYDAARQAAHTGLALLPPTPHVLQVAAHENLGVIDFYTGQMAQAVDHWTRGLAICRRLPHPFKAVDLLNNLGAYHLVAGEWAEAGRLLEEGLAEAEKLGTAHHQALFHLNLGILRTWQGDDDAAEGHLQTLRNHVGEYASNGRYSLADLRLRQGRYTEAAHLLDEAEEMITAAGAAYQWPELHRLRAQLLLAQGERVAAHTAIQESLRLAHDMRMARDEGIALGILGQLLAAEGATAAADNAFRRSLELLADEPYEKARTQMAWGLAQQCAGDVVAGSALLEAAAQRFAHLGAQHDCAIP